MPRTRIAALSILAFVTLATAASFAATSKPEPAPNAPVAQSQDDESEWDERGDWDERGGTERHRHGGGSEGHGPGRGHYGRHGGHRGHRGDMGGHRMAFRAAKDPSASVMHDLGSLERMYRRNGKAEEVPGLYRDVLARTNDPAVRHMAGSRLARLEWQAGNKDAAIELMRKNLDADLKRLK